MAKNILEDLAGKEVFFSSEQGDLKDLPGVIKIIKGAKPYPVFASEKHGYQALLLDAKEKDGIISGMAYYQDIFKYTITKK